VIEAVISTAIFVVLMGVFVRSLFSAQEAQDGAEATERLQRSSLDVVETVRQELSRSGFEGGLPLLYDGDIGGDYDDYAHAPAHDRNGADVERCDIAYRLPADGDGDGWPDVDADGGVIWEADPRAFVLAPDGSGSNAFMHLLPDGRRSTIARNVERVTFSTPAQTNYAIPLDCMSVTVVLREGRGGQARQEQLAFVVKLRNGGLSE
jgi:hypothetical protein